MKALWIGFSVLVVLGLAGGGYWWYQQGMTTGPGPTPTVAVPPMPTEEPLEQWTDPAQFTFQYPKTVTLNPHAEDKINYAHVELTAGSHPGRIIFWVKDTTAATLDDWVKKEKQTAAIDTTLGGLPAKKSLGAKENTIILTTIRNGYLYQIDSEIEDRAFWDPILSKVISSFAFTPEETESEPAGSGSTVDEPVTNSDAPADVEEETIE